MHSSRTIPAVKPLIVLVLLIPSLLFVPVLTLVWRGTQIVSYPVQIFDALVRTFVLSSITALLSVSLGLLFAWFVKSLANFRLNEALSLLLLPTLAGALFWGFFGKVAILRFQVVSQFVEDRSIFATAVFVLALYLAQYATLAAYVLWLRAKAMPRFLTEYGQTIGLSNLETASDLFWPHCRALTYALVFFVFLSSATEFATSDLSLHPSVGTGTAAISHWLMEQYKIWFPAGPDLAAAKIGFYGLASAIFVLLSAMTLGSVYVRAMDSLSRFVHAPSAAKSNKAEAPREKGNRLATTLAALAICFTAAPFLVGYFSFPPHIIADPISLLSAALWTLPVAFTAFLLSSAAAMSIRLWSPWAYRDYGAYRTWFLYVLILHPLAVPPLVFSTSAFWWFGIFSSSADTAVILSWLCGHILKSMPLLVCFAFWTYSRVTDREIEYQRLIGASLSQLVRVTFWDRFRQDHLLLLVFAWTLAWNDAVINRAAAPEIPSLYEILARQLSVRPDYNGAQFCLLVSVVVGIAVIFIWRRIAIHFAKPDVIS